MLTTPLTVPLFSSPSHAWAKVSCAQLINLGVSSKISAFSYRSGTDIYLEEDDDLTIFVEAAKKAGLEIDLVDRPIAQDQTIRQMDPYSPLDVKTGVIIRVKEKPSRSTVEAYLPGNYLITSVCDESVTIAGMDHLGWTLADYIIPRLASGGLAVRPVADICQAM